MNATASREAPHVLLTALGEAFSISSNLGLFITNFPRDKDLIARFNRLASKDVVVPENGFKIEDKFGRTLFLNTLKKESTVRIQTTTPLSPLSPPALNSRRDSRSNQGSIVGNPWLSVLMYGVLTLNTTS